MISQPHRNSADLKTGVLILGLVILYAILVVFISPVSIYEFLSLVWTYAKTLNATFIIILFITLILKILILGIKSKFKASPFSFLYQKTKKKWEQDWFLSLFWPTLTLIILIPSFNVFKQTILAKRGFTTDPLLAKLDSFIFQGNPGLILHEFIGNLGTTLLFDNLYRAWFLPLILGVFLVSISPSPNIRIRYMSCYVFSWIFIGSIIAWFFPSAGPCFYNILVDPYHEQYLQLTNKLYSYHQEKNIHALILQQYLTNAFYTGNLTLGAGISAMPSVHVALAVIFALSSFSVNKWLGYIMTIYAASIWMGSIYLGWHYFFDGLISVILIIFFWKWLLFFEKKK